MFTAFGVTSICAATFPKRRLGVVVSPPGGDAPAAMAGNIPPVLITLMQVMLPEPAVPNNAPVSVKSRSGKKIVGRRRNLKTAAVDITDTFLPCPDQAIGVMRDDH
jgi:hypothetical protein